MSGRPQRRAPLLERIALGLAAFGAASCGASAPRAPNLLVVSIDTTRADRLGCYGRVDAGTPNLDALAERGVRFENAYTPVPVTLPAHTTLLTGTSPRHHGVRDNGRFVVDPALTTLAEVLGARGWRTGATVAAYPLFAEYGLDQGFEFYDDNVRGPNGKNEREADQVVETALAWLEQLERGAPFFLWVHLFDPHQPFTPPEPFASAHPRDPYQAEISFADDQIGRLFRWLESEGLDDDTVVCVVADHGEGLGEHDETTHGLLVHGATTRIPMLFAGPGLPSGAVVPGDARMMDVLPTIAQLLDVPVPEGVQGRSLVSAALGEPEPSSAVYVESYFGELHYGWSRLEGLAYEGWKLVEATGVGPDGDSLYDLRSDPGELFDLARREPQRLDTMRRALSKERARLDAAPAFQTERAMSQAEVEALEALGYGGGVAPATGSELGALDPRERIATAEMFQRGRLFVRQGQLIEAEREYARLQEAEPDGVSAQFLLGLIHAGRFRHEEAIVAFRAALAQAPTHAPLWRRLSTAQWNAGHLEESLESLDTARRLAPGQPDIRELWEERTAELERKSG